MKNYRTILLLGMFLIAFSNQAAESEPTPATTIPVGTVFTMGKNIDLSACADTTTIVNDNVVKTYNAVSSDISFSGGKKDCGSSDVFRGCRVPGEDRILKTGTQCKLSTNKYSRDALFLHFSDCSLVLICTRSMFDPRSSPISISSLRYNLGGFITFPTNQNSTVKNKTASDLQSKNVRDGGASPSTKTNTSPVGPAK